MNFPSKHDDITGESLAELWHRIAGAVSIIAAISGIGIAFTAAAGAAWHRWAARQHRIEIERIKKELSCEVDSTSTASTGEILKEGQYTPIKASTQVQTYTKQDNF